MRWRVAGDLLQLGRTHLGAASDRTLRRKAIGPESGEAEDHADQAAIAAVAGQRGLRGIARRLGDLAKVMRTGLQLQRCETILKETFTAMGKSADWARVEKKALANNGSGQTGMNGIPIQQALESELGWKGVFWAPDPTFQYKKKDGTDDTEHSYAYHTAKKGKYYKVSVEHTVVNFAPEAGSSTKQDVTALDKLKKIPFGVLTARGARHMALIVKGVVYEVHWNEGSSKAALYGATPLEEWGWDSGAIVAPAEDVTAAFK